jgi:alcohol dehydrogenase (NADP+)
MNGKSDKKANDLSMPERRNIIKGGVGFAAASLLAQTAVADESAAKQTSDAGPFNVRAYGNANADAPLEAMTIERRALGPNDVLLEVLYSGICHSDIHQARDEWRMQWGPTAYPCVPGHEIIGRVQAVGDHVTKFRVGDIGGVGCVVNSCRDCDNCDADLEQYCQKATFTYNSPDADRGGAHTLGGYSEKMVVAEHFVVRIPPGMNLAGAAPLLCAGITTFSALQHWKIGSQQRVGVIGLGGLGHMAVKLAVAKKADVTVFTTSPGKTQDAKKMGAREVVLWSDADAMKRLAGKFDVLIATVPKAFPIQQFMPLLKIEGTLVNVGAMESFPDVRGMDLVYGRRGIAGSMIGGIAETQEMIDFCAARNIVADVEVIAPSEINQAFDRVVNKDVRYRFVIDMAKA